MHIDHLLDLWLNGSRMDDTNKQLPPTDDPFAESNKDTSSQIPSVDTVLVPESPDNTDAMNTPGEFNYLQNLQTQINLNIATIDRLKEEMQPVKEMIDDMLNNDPEYLELTKRAKEASTEKGARKKELLSQPQGKALEDKMSKLKEEQKEANDMISQLLAEYRQTTGANEFEGSDGELRTIVMIAKLVRKTNLNRE